MQRLNEKWLRYINYYFIASALIIVLLYAFFAFEQKTLFVEGKDQFGVSILSGLSSVAFLLYNLIFLPIIRKSNVWIAYVISILSYAVISSLVVEISLKSSTSLIFLLNNYFIVIASVALGPIVPLFAIGIVWIIYVMTLSGANPTMLGVAGDGISVLLRTLIVVFLIFKLKNKYETEGVDNDNYIERYFVNNEVVKLLTDSISDGVMIVDNKGIVKSVNPGVSRLIRRDIKDMIGLDYAKLMKLKSMNSESLKKEDHPIYKSLKSNLSSSRELILDQSDDEQRYIDIDSSAISDPRTSEIYGAVVIVRDVSERKREEEARTEFISTASHEMRTPVAAIEGYLALALNPSVGNIDEKSREFLEKAHENTEHLGRLFQDLLISSKAEDGRLVNHPKDVELGKFLHDQVEISRISAENKGIHLRFIIGSEADIDEPMYYSSVDPDRMKELITNLIDNAIKYTDSGTVEVGLTGNKEIVQIYVKDSGIGMSGNEIPHLFQKFYRVDNSTTRTTGGTGLGLYICRKIVELYNGRIWVESERGAGSTFFVNLPRLSNSKSDQE